MNPARVPGGSPEHVGALAFGGPGCGPWFSGSAAHVDSWNWNWYQF